MKIVYNACHGGFRLSSQAKARYAELKGLAKCPYDDEIPRHDPALVQTVEELGTQASTDVSALQIVEIPDGSWYRTDEDYGMEWVETPDTIDWVKP